MVTRYTLLCAGIIASLAFGCDNAPEKNVVDQSKPNLIHPIDTGPQLDSNRVKLIKEYSLEHQNDAGVGYDVGDSPEQSLPMALGKTNVGLVGTVMDQADEYRVQVPEDKTVEAVLVTGKTSRNLNFEIWDSDMREIWSQFSIDPDAEVSFTFPPGTKGEHFLIVSHAYAGGPYKLTFRERPKY